MIPPHKTGMKVNERREKILVPSLSLSFRLAPMHQQEEGGRDARETGYHKLRSILRGRERERIFLLWWQEENPKKKKFVNEEGEEDVFGGRTEEGITREEEDGHKLSPNVFLQKDEEGREREESERRKREGREGDKFGRNPF